jgi:tripartite-type tricarboxylate transporter receptor subunit TctC
VLVPVTRVASGIAILVASPAFGVRTLQDVLARARARPGAVRYAASGALGRLLGEMIKDAVQIDMLEIPYKTQSQELTQLMSGQVDLSVTFISVVQSHLQSGKLVPIAVASSRRHGGVPDVPTFGEAGVPGVEATGWIGFFVPIKTPERIIMSVHREVRRALETDDIREDYVGAGLDIGGEPPEAFAAFIRTRPSVGANSSGSAISS